MFQVYVDQGLCEILLRAVENDGDGLTWAVFENDEDVDHDSQLIDFDLPIGAWSRVNLHAIDFILQQVVANVGTIQAMPITFTNGELVSIDLYGFVVYDPVGEKLFAAARFDDAPRTLAPGSSTVVQAILGDYSASLIPTVDGGEF